MKLKEVMKQRMPISNGMFLFIVLMFSLASAICAGLTAAIVVYDNSKSGLLASNVQDAIDEILTKDIEKKGNINIFGKIKLSENESELTISNQTQDSTFPSPGGEGMCVPIPVTVVSDTCVDKWLEIYVGTKKYYLPLFE